MIDLKKRRKELGLTMQEVADAVEVSEATISRYENGGIKNMRRDRIEKYAGILKVDILDIIGSEERSIGEKIRLLREKKGMSQIELAEKTVYPITSIIKYENNERKPTDIVKHKLAEILEVSVDEVFPHKLGEIFDFRDDIDVTIDEKLIMLNHYGKQKALEYITDLSEQLKYTEQT